MRHHPTTLPIPEPHGRIPSLSALFEQFIYQAKYTRRRSAETIRGYQNVFRLFAKLCPDITLDQLTPDALTEFFRQLETRERVVGKGIIKQGVKTSTIATHHAKLRTFFEWLVVRSYLTSNPLDGFGRPRPYYDDVRALRRSEIDRIATAIEMHSRHLLQLKRDRLILALFVLCGLRRGELLGLQVSDVDLERSTLRIGKDTSKSNRSRIIPLNNAIRLHLDDYLRERRKKRTYTTPALIVSLDYDAGLTKDGLKHWVERLKSQSGVRFHIHQFRHTFATNLGGSGVNAIQLQRLLGHCDLRVTQRYVHSLTTDDLRPAMNRSSFDNLA
jgi:integrase/recombinase XerD